MTAFPFDTHRIVKELEEAGFSEKQAEAVVTAVGAAISGNLATKADLDLLKAELKAEFKAENAALRDEIKAENAAFRDEIRAENAAFRAEIKAENAALKDELKADNTSMRTEFQGETADIKSRIQSLELRMTLRMGGIAAAAVGIAVAVVRIFS